MALHGLRRTLGTLALTGALVLSAVGSAIAAEAVDELRRGPQIGFEASEILAASDQSGTPQTFRSLRGKRGLILMFSRSFDW